ncbi:anaerobic sulfatase maturase [Methanocella sp. CWC-04]|uniref:Anaerobic sulfatase maturase n=1 Tax=Methanooceanicella nereidis TaxID=2052831 RepID=A0AAP2RGS2_9EURY|nr:anaerobic sulfatase maturase [Methanocella sp. CWC-04]MCD1295885.1 anaerobic sulfatase maturase [Methanocella sp. CWC-04]
MTNKIPARIHVLAKPTGAICNLNCSYCFFLDKESLYPDSDFRMSDKVLETYIRQLIESHKTKEVTVAWQGGEPTLMGIDFFKRAIEFQEKFKKPGMIFHNTLQTNGTLLNDEWCRFFRDNDYLIGISIDGPKELHDIYRKDKAGRPTFDRVMRGLRLLQKHNVEYNVLTAVNKINAERPLDVYRFLRDEACTTWMQFIPVVERINEEGTRLYQRGDVVSDRSVMPGQFGNFLNRIFDEWVRHDVGRIFVQTFEASIRNWLRLPSSGMCVFDPVCGYGMALEHNGDLYSCDHFVEPDYLLGNINETHLSEMAASDRQRKFGDDKLKTLPKYCLDCDVRFACHGECPKNRFLIAPSGEPGLNYLCDGYKSFFHHIDRPANLIAGLLLRGYPAENVMKLMAEEDRKHFKAGRNDPCPCGSGIKFKKCHGRPSVGVSQRYD